eukprot:3965348-Lingulodinium_polyedra.AAC.1
MDAPHPRALAVFDAKVRWVLRDDPEAPAVPGANNRSSGRTSCSASTKRASRRGFGSACLGRRPSAPMGSAPRPRPRRS